MLDKVIYPQNPEPIALMSLWIERVVFKISEQKYIHRYMIRVEIQIQNIMKDIHF